MISRATQPYRQDDPARRPGHALSAMLAGRTLHGFNPQDLERVYARPEGLAWLLMRGIRPGSYSQM